VCGATFFVLGKESSKEIAFFSGSADPRKEAKEVGGAFLLIIRK